MLAGDTDEFFTMRGFAGQFVQRAADAAHIAQVDAFVQLLKEIGQSDYQASLKEMRTYEVIEDVANLHSEIGIVYLSRYNRQVMENKLPGKGTQLYAPL